MSAHDLLKYRPDIQGLRAIAIMLVVLAHANVPGFQGGFVGVDVFFTLSGYLITGLLLEEYSRTGKIRLAAFYARRLKRLLPALLAMIVLVALGSSLVLSSHEFYAQSRSLFYAAAWTSNLFFAFTRLDYFNELATRDLFLHTWSLGVEEQFYLVWPVLLLATLAMLSSQRAAIDRHRRLLAVLFTVMIASFGLSWIWTQPHPQWSFYLMPSRIWQFGLGACVYVWHQRIHHPRESGPTPEAPAGWQRLNGIGGLLLIIGSGMILHRNVTYPGFWAIAPSLGAALVIAAGHPRHERGANRLLSHPWLVWMGDRSYSWYLWHWPILMLGFAWGANDLVAGAPALVVLSLLVATVSYRFIEIPFWKGRLGQLEPQRIMLASVLVMLLVIVGGRTYTSRFAPSDYSAVITPANAARADLPVIYGLGCDEWYVNAEVKPCLIGESSAPKIAVLLGDSILAQWFSLLPAIYQAPDWRIVVLTKSSCAMVDEEYFYSRIGSTYTVCTAWRNSVLDYLQTLRPEIVFTGSMAGYDFTDSQWLNGSMRVLARLTQAARHVVVIPGTPLLTFDGPTCVEQRTAGNLNDLNRFPAGCRENLADSQSATVAGYLAAAVAGFENATVLDLSDLVCPEQICRAQDDSGTFVFRDNQHLTDSFVKLQAQQVYDRLRERGLPPTADN